MTQEERDRNEVSETEPAPKQSKPSGSGDEGAPGMDENEGMSGGAPTG